jgi:GntR family transcriptional regulator
MLDPNTDIPVFRQLADLLRAQIESGELEPGRPLPSVRQLVQRYEVADGTVKKAIGVLRDAGLVVSVQGKGTYVSRPR